MKEMFPFLSGTVTVRICGGSRERFLNLCANRDIRLWQIRSDADSMTVRMNAPDFLHLKPLARKCRVRLRIIRKNGLPFFLKRHRKHKLFALGMFCCCFFLYLLSMFIWKIEIIGNQTLTRSTLMSYLRDQEISYGSRKSELDCKQIAADLRNAFPVITWVSVEQVGTLLRIELKENQDVSENQEHVQGTDSEENGSDLGTKERTAEENSVLSDQEETGVDFLAPHDGTVVSIFARAGTPQVQAGDEVTKGQVLVSGALLITNDSDEVTAVHYCRADADIELEIEDVYQEELPIQETRYTYTGECRRGWYLKVSGYWLSNLQDCAFYEIQDCLKTETQLCLFADFYLPVSFGQILVREREPTLHLYSEEEAKTVFEAHLQKFIQENQEKGVQIFEKNVRIDSSVDYYSGTCRYRAIVTAMEEAPTESIQIQPEGTS